MIGLLTLLLLVMPFSVYSFADWMTKDYCDRPILSGEIIMNNPAVDSNERLIIVSRDGKYLTSGDTYISGEKLDVTITQNDRKIQQVFETTKNAKFVKGGCDGTRSSKEKSILEILPSTDDIIKISAGWANGHEEVKLAPVFILNPPVREQGNATSTNQTVTYNVLSYRFIILL